MRKQHPGRRIGCSMATMWAVALIGGLIAQPAMAQFRPGEFHGARWDPTLRCWVYDNEKATIGVPWNQRLLGKKSDADDKKKVVSGGDKRPLAPVGPPLVQLNMLPGAVIVVPDGVAPPGAGDAQKQIIGHAVKDADAARDFVSRPVDSGDAGGKPDRSKEAEFLAFAALGGSSGSGGRIGDLNGVTSSLRPPTNSGVGASLGPSFTAQNIGNLSQGRIDLGGIELPLFGPNSSSKPPFGIPPVPPALTAQRLPPLTLTEEQKKKLTEAAKKFQKKVTEAPDTGELKAIVTDLKEMGGVIDEVSRQADPEGNLALLAAEHHLISTISAVELNAMMNAPSITSFNGAPAFMDGPRKLSDGTQHYPYVSGLPITDTFLRPDGGLVTAYGDGSREWVGPDGTRVLKTKDGRRRIVNPDGSVVWLSPDGKPVVVETENDFFAHGPDGGRPTIQVGDFEGDGKVDIATYRGERDMSQWFVMSGFSNYIPQTWGQAND